MPTRTGSHTTKPVIALDGPSALALYRDRAALVAHEPDERRTGRDSPEDYDVNKLDWLSDEDVASSLAAENAFGHRAQKDDSPAEQERKGLVPLKRSRTRQFSTCASRSRDLKLIPYEALGISPPSTALPLHILVPNASAKRRVRNVHQRSCTHKVPSNSLRWLGDHVLVPSPELTFLLLAQSLDLAELTAIGMELCGHYRLTGATPANPLHSRTVVYNCSALTSPHKIARLLERAEDFPGVLKAQRACRHMEANAASPMETILYLLLCLPRHLGGYGLPHPMLNAKRKVNEEAEAFTFAHTLVPDLYWPEAMLDMEYDSDEFHSDPESLRAGARRTLALRAMHVDVISMTYDVVHDEDSFHGAARMVARKLHKRLYKTDAASQKKRAQLRAGLFR